MTDTTTNRARCDCCVTNTNPGFKRGSCADCGHSYRSHDLPAPAGHPDELIDQAAQILAVNALARYAQEYVADHLSPADFKDNGTVDARQLADAGLLADPELRTERDAAIRERDLAIAHDRQPYPTAWAYEQACRVMHERTAERDHLRIDLNSTEENLTDARRERDHWNQRFEDLQTEHGKCIASWDRHRALLKTERDEARAELTQMRKNWDAAREANMTALATIRTLEQG